VAELLGLQKIIVVSRIPDKDEEVRALYGDVEIWRGLTFSRLKSLSDCVLVLEDYTEYRKNKALQRVVERLVTTLARVKRILTVVVGHRAKMEMPANLEVEVDVDENGKHFYQIREGKKTTDWLDCEWNDGEIKKEKLQPLIDAVFQPVKGKELGFQGRRINPNSKRQRAFKLFNEGRSNKEVQAILQISNELARHYRYLWKQEKTLTYSRFWG
jgi:hypothetical protein